MVNPDKAKEMDDKLMESMLSYYDEWAHDYDDIYAGKGPAILDPIIYINETREIGKRVATFGKNHLIDIGCGTGFWLPFYARNCSRITLIDQSEKMLVECKRRVDELGLNDKCDILQGNFFELDRDNYQFDSAFIGFLISHFTPNQEQEFFAKLKNMLRSNSKLMLIDSAWSRKREQYRLKEGIVERVLNDGRTFKIYKRYFGKSDVEKMFERHRFELESFYMGDVFLAVAGENKE